MGKNYDLYSPYQRTIDNLKRRIRGYEKMKKDLTKQYRKTNKENQELKKQNQKYKEVMDRLIKLIEEEHYTVVDDYYDYFIEGVHFVDEDYHKLLDILKEVE